MKYTSPGVVSSIARGSCGSLLKGIGTSFSVLFVAFNCLFQQSLKYQFAGQNSFLSQGTKRRARSYSTSRRIETLRFECKFPKQSHQSGMGFSETFPRPPVGLGAL